MPGRLADQSQPPAKPDQKRADWSKHRRLVRAANRARYRAEQRLVAEQRERFDEIYAQEAQREGVTPRPTAQTAQRIQAEIERLRALLATVQEDGDGPA